MAELAPITFFVVSHSHQLTNKNTFASLFANDYDLQLDTVFILYYLNA